MNVCYLPRKRKVKVSYLSRKKTVNVSYRFRKRKVKVSNLSRKRKVNVSTRVMIQPAQRGSPPLVRRKSAMAVPITSCTLGIVILSYLHNLIYSHWSNFFWLEKKPSYGALLRLLLNNFY